MTIKRAPFPEHLQRVRDLAPELVEMMEDGKGWYASVFVQDQVKSTYRVDTKQEQVGKEDTAGARLVVYDGETFFERATDDLSDDSLMTAALALRDHVEKHGAANPSRPYSPPSWTERDIAALDLEIRDQIPHDVTASTQVHFGVRYQDDPLSKTTQDLLEHCRDAKETILALSKRRGVEVDLAAAVLWISDENSMFIDRSVNLSQRLVRTEEIAMTVAKGEKVYSVVGGLGGFELAKMPPENIEELLRVLPHLADGERIAPGRYTIVTGVDVSGTLAHEAAGHPFEGDTQARGRSIINVLQAKGVRIGNDHATILNNPAMFTNGVEPCGATGSYFFDEEGWLSREQVILKKGWIKDPMTNLSAAIRLGVPRSANGRREDWSHASYARQTNTYFATGEKTLAELIASVDYGFFAQRSWGGMEDPKGMGIQVGVLYLEEIKKGKLTGRIMRGPNGGAVQVTGFVPELLRSIRDVSKISYWTDAPDSAEHPLNKIGGCGKYYKESIKVGAGGPCLLIDNVQLG